LKKTVLVLAMIGLGTAPLHAFQRETTNDPGCAEGPGVDCPHRGTPLSWRSFPVLYFINSDASGLSLSAVRSPIDTAFSTWQSGSRSGITFAFGGQSHNGSNGQDGQNTISWQSLTNATDTFAQTVLTFDTQSGEILDADVELNRNFQFGVLPAGEDDPSDPTVDVQAVLTHEAGHFLGLDHENRFGQQVVMFFSDTTGDTTHRALTGDDLSGVRAIYPSSGGATGGGGNGGGNGGGCRLDPSAATTDELAPVFALLAWLVARQLAGSIPSSRRRFKNVGYEISSASTATERRPS
jgi:hypothetical protein